MFIFFFKLLTKTAHADIRTKTIFEREKISLQPITPILNKNFEAFCHEALSI